MKYLVTGGAGFIGSNIVDFLIKNNQEVIVIDNESSDAHEQFYWNNKAKNYKYDICDYEKIFPLFFEVDVVFHLAAEARIQPCIINPQKAIETNIKGTFNVLESSRKNNVKRVIYSSTSSAYGLKNLTPSKEDMPKDCLNPYSVTKTCGEELCSMYTKLYGLETVIFRYFNVYGERQPLRGQYAPVIGIFLKQKRNKESLTVVGDGLQRRDFTNVEDIVKANYLASDLNNKECVGQIINVGTSKNHSILEIAKMISENIIFIEYRIGEAKETLACTE
jgi:UDP-glucose 4-epimerase